MTLPLRDSQCHPAAPIIGAAGLARSPAYAVLVPQGLFVYFDLPLEVGLALETNWLARVNNRRLILTSGTIFPDHVRFVTGFGAVEFGSDVCSYTAALPDVKGTNGAFVEAFFGFPITRT